jgi:hypothetical protein
MGVGGGKAMGQFLPRFGRATRSPKDRRSSAFRIGEYQKKSRLRFFT